MNNYIMRLILYFVCYFMALFALSAFDYNRFLKKKVNPWQAQLLYLLLSAAFAYLIANFFMGILYVFNTSLYNR